MLTGHKDNHGGRRAAPKIAAGAFWRVPGRFVIARTLGSSYSLRCVVFHNVSIKESLFTKGMGVTITPDDLEAALKFLTRHYAPVSLQDVLTDSDGRGLPQRAVLVTFDDGYASVVQSAELCRKFRVPAIFFLNVAVLDNCRLAPDNLVCYVANVLGMRTINRAARAVKGASAPHLHALADIFADFFPAISLFERQSFLKALTHLAGIDESQLAREVGLYLTRRQVRSLADWDFEIGNHTYTHVHCRWLTAEHVIQEVDGNKAELEALSGRKVRSFSLPYGSSADLTGTLVKHLERSGHEAAFLSESVANPRGADRLGLDRVSIRGGGDDTLFFEIEILPRLRAIRNHLLRGLRWIRTSRKVPSGVRLAARNENFNGALERTQHDS